MKQATNTYFLKNNFGVLATLSVVLLIVLISGYLFFQLMPGKNNSFFYLSGKNSRVYILVSQENESYLNKINISAEAYEDNINSFIKKLSLLGIKTEIINENELYKLKKNDTLIALDTYSVSSDTMKKIKKFLSKGGNFLFNYHFGYFRADKFVKAENIEALTNLKYISESKSSTGTDFYIPKTLSPLILGQNAYRHDLVLYSGDTLPLFKSVAVPDAILTNWEITSTPVLNGKMLKTDDSGVVWHGFYGKGKWFYFSFPSYVFLDMPNHVFKKYFNNIFEYLNNTFTIAKYPFLDAKSAVFISEDTEYKYGNMIHFAKLANSFHIPVTLFCVVKLALKNKQITKEAALLPNVEIGSHSYTHTKIQGAPETKVIKEIAGSKKALEQITGKQVYGFRPPREEIDKPMENILRKSGYKYVMEKTKSYLLPTDEHKNLITIPRHGTDDYIFLINLNWDKEKILKKIIQETKMLTDLNSIYTLSVHTHLLSYKSNLSVSEKYFKYLSEHKNLKAFKGIDIAHRINRNKNIIVSSHELNNKTFVYINNKNGIEIKNFSFRIYWPNSQKITVFPEMSNVKIKILLQNKKEKYTDMRIETLKPHSTISIILESDE